MTDAAMDRAMACIERAARRSAFHMVKQRARAYRKRPADMIALDARLPSAAARTMIAIGEHLLERACGAPSGRLVQLAPVSLTNARAVIVLGRYERRFGQLQREVA